MSTLRSCLDEAKEAILAGDTDHAIDLCFHVLCSFPKCVEAHCLLGEAYRERGLSAQAEETFRRVLSADPENLIARWALSILADDRGEAELAILELTRAFELNSGHPELRQEMAHRLESDISLTRGALGRLYARGEIFDRAAAEFRAVLAVEPGRLDVLVALAETLWRNEQHDEARAICQQILADSPDCLKANIMLGYLFHLSGDQQKAKKYLERAELLDPENAVAEQLTEGMDIEVLLPAAQVEIATFEAIDTHLDSEQTAGESSDIFPVNLDADEEIDEDEDDEDEIVEDEDAPFGVGLARGEPLTGSIEQTGRRNPGSREPFAPAVEFPNAEPVPVEDKTIVFDAKDDSSGGEQGQWHDHYGNPARALSGTNEDGHPVGNLPERARGQGHDPHPNPLPEKERGQDDLTAASQQDETAVPEPQGQDAAQIEEIDRRSETAQAIVSVPAQAIETEIEDESETVEAAEVPVNFEGDRAGQGQAPPADNEADQITESQRKTQSDPGNFPGRLDLAMAYYEASQIDQAVAELGLVLKSAPDLVDRVIEGLKSIVSANPDHILANRRLGDAYMKIGRFQDAIDCYNRCLSKQKSTGPARRR